MDVDRVFKHIEGDDSPLPVVKENKKRKANKSYINIGMFIKMIANIEIFIRKFKKEMDLNGGEDINEELLQNNLRKIIYTRAYDNLSKIDLNNDSQLKYANKFDTRLLKSSTVKAIMFFEECEEFEKCHFIKEFQHKVGLKEKLGHVKEIQ